MKIVINALSARLGGGQTYLVNILAHLPQAPDLEILIFCPPSLALPQDPRITRGVIQWPVENPLMRAFWEKWELPRILNRERAQVLFCPGGAVNTRVPAFCKVVTMFRNMIPFDQAAMDAIPFGLQKFRNYLLKGIMLKSMKNADLTIFISNFARQVIEKHITVKNGVTIPHGISEIFRAQAPMTEEVKIPEGQYLLYVSRFDVYKHHVELVTAYSRLPSSVRDQHPLVLVGEVNMAHAQRVIELIRELGVDGQVRVLGAIKYQHLPVLYRHAFLNIFASSCENCPNILLEILASGRPVFCSDVLPMPEFGGDAPIYFSPFDSDDVLAKLQVVLSDQVDHEEMARRSTVRSQIYDWKLTAGRTWNDIMSLTSSAKESA